MRNFFRNVHFYLAAIFGLFITIICLTGAVLIFENEITNAIIKDKLYVQKDDANILSIEQLMAKASAVIPDDVKITGITIFSDPNKAYQIQISKPKKAYIIINQYTGEIISKQQQLPFFNFILKLHRWLLQPPSVDGTSIGRLIVGVSVIAFIFIIFTGLFIWIPKSRKALKNRLSIETHKGFRRFIYDIHVANGFYCIIILLSLAFTGLTWSFPWYKNAFYSLFGANSVEKSILPESKEKSEDLSIVKKYESWQSVLNDLKNKTDNYSQISLSDNVAKISRNRVGNQRATDNYYFNSSGKITSVQLYKDSSKNDKVKGWVYSVHVGAWGGIITKIINFIVSLIGTILPITGIYIWYKKGIRNV
jgi:Uncharacterized iron-regulated membrane protein